MFAVLYAIVPQYFLIEYFLYLKNFLMTGGRFSVLFGGEEDKEGKAHMAFVALKVKDW